MKESSTILCECALAVGTPRASAAQRPKIFCIHVCRWTTRAILTGWKETEYPSSDDQLKLSTDPDFFEEWEGTDSFVSGQDLTWLLKAGQFKVLWILIKKLDLIKQV